MKRVVLGSSAAFGMLLVLFAGARLAFASAPTECHKEVVLAVPPGGDPTQNPYPVVSSSCVGECLIGPQVCHKINDPVFGAEFCRCWYDANGDGIPQSSEVVSLRCCDIVEVTSGGSYTGAYGCAVQDNCCINGNAACKIEVLSWYHPPYFPGYLVTVTCTCQ